MIKTEIIDGGGSGTGANVDDSNGEENALVVATRPLKTYEPKTLFFTNDTYGREMNQDGLFGGVAVLIHNGADDVAWTYSEEVGGKWTENSGDRAYAGSTSLKCDNPAVGDILQLLNNLGPGTNIDLTNYIALSMWVNIDKDWAADDDMSIYGYLTDGAGAQVGTAVDLSDYLTIGNTDIWQYVVIPFTDMALSTSTVDAFRIQNMARGGGKSPKFYIDNFYLQQSGEAIEFTLEPTKGKWFHVRSYQTTFVDVHDDERGNATLPNIAYDKFLSMAATAGYLFKDMTGDVVNQYARITNIGDLLAYPYSEITSQISDGTNTLITISHKYPEDMKIVLKAEELDKLVYSIEDDFSALVVFRVSVMGYEETR